VALFREKWFLKLFPLAQFFQAALYLSGLERFLTRKCGTLVSAMCSICYTRKNPKKSIPSQSIKIVLAIFPLSFL